LPLREKPAEKEEKKRRGKEEKEHTFFIIWSEPTRLWVLSVCLSFVVRTHVGCCLRERWRRPLSVFTGDGDGDGAASI
jgi:hypothetical protein